VERTFVVSVPADASPGEHITSLAIEPEAASAGQGSLQFDQRTRQVIAVDIDVEGPREPRLVIGRSAHHAVAGKFSTLAVAVSNPGNVLLRPAGKIVIRESDGDEIATAPVSMGSFYAGTDSEVQVTLSQILNEGRYTAAVSLADSATSASARGTVSFEVASAELSESRGTAPAPAEVRQTSREKDDVEGESRSALLLLLGTVIALALAVGLVGRRTVGRRRARGATSPTGK
jgi:hypothetical protein